MANLRHRLNRLQGSLSRQSRLPSSEECAGSRERLLRRLQGMAERTPERRAAWEALSPEEKARGREWIRERIVERLRAMGFRR